MIDKLLKLDPIKLNPISIIESLETNIKKVEERIMLLDRVLTNFDLGGYKRTETEIETETEDEDDFIAHLGAGLREIEIAKQKAGCPVVQNIIDEILLFAEEKMEDIKMSRKDVVKVAEDVLREEGVSDWSSLSPEERKILKDKIRSRLITP